MTLFDRWLGSGRQGKAFQHLRPGRYYRLQDDFRDHDGRVHPCDQRWRYCTHNFLPYEDGLSLFFITDRGEDRHIRLQWRADAEGPVIDALESILLPCEPPFPSAFAGLRSVEDDKLTSFNGVNLVTFDWHDIRKIIAAYGQQQYDMTRCLTIDHIRGNSIFLPESEHTWQPFLDGVEAKLEHAVPRHEWQLRLEGQPSRSVLVWKHTNMLRRLFRKLR